MNRKIIYFVFTLLSLAKMSIPSDLKKLAKKILHKQTGL